MDGARLFGRALQADRLAFRPDGSSHVAAFKLRDVAALLPPDFGGEYQLISGLWQGAFFRFTRTHLGPGCKNFTIKHQVFFCLQKLHFRPARQRVPLFGFGR